MQGPQIPAVEIYVPSLKVWEDEEEDEEDGAAQQGQEQQQTNQAEARAEVTDGLRELRDFMNVNKQRHDPVKQIWDERKDRELLQAGLLSPNFAATSSSSPASVSLTE